MEHLLTYMHARNIFVKSEFKPFVRKYFKDVEFIGFEFGMWSPTIKVSNYEEVKNILPKYAKPVKIEKVV